MSFAASWRHSSLPAPLVDRHQQPPWARRSATAAFVVSDGRTHRLCGRSLGKREVGHSKSYIIQDMDKYIREWVRSACVAWRYGEPGPDYYERIVQRLPAGLRSLLAAGIEEGPKFTLRGLTGKGPYAWFSKRSTPREPSPNWEYFVQAAEFVRLSRLAAAHGMTVTFEDQLMDLALYRDGRLVVCCEVKEKASQIQELLKDIKQYEQRRDLSQPDRGNDALRKAKYIVKRRPEYFALVAIGARLEYQVDYPPGKAFALHRDVIPWA